MSELKEENGRKSSQIRMLIKVIVTLIVTFVIAVGTIVGGFLWYLNQYDFVSEQTVQGTYAIVDSDGNVIAHDLSPEEIQSIQGAGE